MMNRERLTMWVPGVERARRALAELHSRLTKYPSEVEAHLPEEGFAALPMTQTHARRGTLNAAVFGAMAGLVGMYLLQLTAAVPVDQPWLLLFGAAVGTALGAFAGMIVGPVNPSEGLAVVWDAANASNKKGLIVTVESSAPEVRPIVRDVAQKYGAAFAIERPGTLAEQLEG